MFDVTKYWEERYANGGNSGAGSYGQEAMVKSFIVNQVIEDYKVKFVQEVGCGDGNNLQFYNIKEYYVGYDISDTAIKLCWQKYSDKGNYLFTTEPEELGFGADLCLCLDVLFHQVDDKLYEETLDLLFKRNANYVLIYTYDYEDNNPDWGKHMKFRKSSADIEARGYNYKLKLTAAGYDMKKTFLLYEKK